MAVAFMEQACQAFKVFPENGNWEDIRYSCTCTFSLVFFSLFLIELIFK